MSNGKAKHVINVDNLGLWQGCDGAYYTRYGHCAVCGKTADCHGAVAGSSHTVAERAAADALRQTRRAIKSLPPIAGKLRIKFTRGYKSIPLDRDNLIGGCKPLRDEIARIYGRDDAEFRGITWEYDQAKGAVHKVEIWKEG